MVFYKIVDFQHNWTRKLLEENNLYTGDVFDDKVQLYACFHGVVPVAMGGLERYGDVAMLRSVCTKSHVKGKGMGRKFMDLVIEEARKEGIKDLYLITENKRRFFKKFGFEKMPFEEMPESIRNTHLAQNVCSSKATSMHLKL